MNRLESTVKRLVVSVGIGAALMLMQVSATAGPGDVDKSGAAFWQWALSIPAAANPLLDATGADCMVGQSGGVWYLAGTFGAASATRSCSVPEGTAFFVPVINEVNVNVPGLCGQGASQSSSELRAQIVAFIDGATNLSLTVDGIAVKNVRRIKSGVFALTFPEDNLFNLLCGPGAIPAGVYSPAIDDGYYGQVNALSPGAHIVHIHSESPNFFFTLDVTYNLNVVATINH